MAAASYVPPAAPSTDGAAGGGVLAKPSTLPLALTDTLDKYDLYDPTRLADKEADDLVGLIGAGTLLTFLLPIFETGFLADVGFSALIGGGLASYLGLRKDTVGTISRNVAGGLANKAAVGAYEAAVEVEEEYQLTDKAKRKGKEVIDDVIKKVKEGL